MARLSFSLSCLPQMWPLSCFLHEKELLSKLSGLFQRLLSQHMSADFMCPGRRWGQGLPMSPSWATFLGYLLQYLRDTQRFSKETVTEIQTAHILNSREHGAELIITKTYYMPGSTCSIFTLNPHFNTGLMTQVSNSKRVLEESWEG